MPAPAVSLCNLSQPDSMHPGVAMAIRGSLLQASEHGQLWDQYTLLGLRHNYRVRLPRETGICIVQSKTSSELDLAIPGSPFPALLSVG